MAILKKSKAKQPLAISKIMLSMSAGNFHIYIDGDETPGGAARFYTLSLNASEAKQFVEFYGKHTA